MYVFSEKVVVLMASNVIKQSLQVAKNDTTKLTTGMFILGEMMC